jgi:hypothetical protein
VKVKSTANFKRGIDAISEFVPQLPENVRGQVEQYVNMIYANLKKAKLNAGLKEQADYIDTKLNKKGF